MAQQAQQSQLISKPGIGCNILLLIAMSRYASKDFDFWFI